MKFDVQLEYDPPGKDSDAIVTREDIEKEYGLNGNPLRYFLRVVKAIGNGNYLREDLYETVAQGEVRLAFYVHRQNGGLTEELTPLENALRPWKIDKSRSVQGLERVKVATLVIPRQERNPRLEELAENLGFSPGNYLFGHRPVGNMGRGRIFSYEASQEGRGVNEEDTQRYLREVYALANPVAVSGCAGIFSGL